MLSSKIKDLKLRKSFHIIEKKKKVKKFIFTNVLNKRNMENNFLLTKVQAKNLFFSTINLLSKKNQISKVKLTRRCVLNNRSRGVVRPLGISRVYLRELMHFGFIPGYKKAVW